MTQKFDVVIGGAGPIGLAVACALQDAGLRILLIEPRPRDSISADPRVIAISFGSRLLLERLGAWTNLSAAAPITTVHVSERGGFGSTALTAKESGLPALGYVARIDELHRAFASSLRMRSPQAGTLDWQTGARIVQIESRAGYLSVTSRQSDGRSTCVHASLLVVADGGCASESLPDATIQTVDYQQSALLATVRAECISEGLAFERFVPEGPIALLPFERGMALVWITTPARAQSLLTMREADFLARLHSDFGDRLGRFTQVAGRAVSAISRRTVSVDAERLVLVGNASQTLHPVAGQGFNLGLRDAWELAQLIARRGINPETVPETLRLYAGQRHADRHSSQWLTDSLVRIFSADRTLLKLSRNAGLTMLDIASPLRRAFARRMAFGIRFGQ